MQIPRSAQEQSVREQPWRRGSKITILPAGFPLIIQPSDLCVSTLVLRFIVLFRCVTASLLFHHWHHTTEEPTLDKNAPFSFRVSGSRSINDSWHSQLDKGIAKGDRRTLMGSSGTLKDFDKEARSGQARREPAAFQITAKFWRLGTSGHHHRSGAPLVSRVS